MLFNSSVLSRGDTGMSSVNVCVVKLCVLVKSCPIEEIESG